MLEIFCGIGAYLSGNILDQVLLGLSVLDSHIVDIKL